MASNKETASDLCDQINEKLIAAENEDQVTTAFLTTILEEFSHCLSLDPNLVEAYLGKAYVYGHLGDFNEGFATLDAVSKIAPDDSRIQDMRQTMEELQEPDDDHDDHEQEELGDNSVEVPSQLIEGSSLSPKLDLVLKEIFARLDSDKDGALNPTELGQLYQSTNGEAIKQTTIQFFRQNFACNEQGSLTLEGFLQFYELQTFTDPDETLRDLKALGYDSNLNPL
eukprot:TRINITY_DN6864_c0_g1_i1.p1 TRINITY_DN6864_c0_g1~~TRINITY_DN6864_c0_g1_i1.p1  ORF type:complete len:226 (+),score=63.08 TRINITY_DN6864_c0_g1_i1:108-785(+)